MKIKYWYLKIIARPAELWRSVNNLPKFVGINVFFILTFLIVADGVFLGVILQLDSNTATQPSHKIIAINSSGSGSSTQSTGGSSSSNTGGSSPSSSTGSSSKSSGQSKPPAKTSSKSSKPSTTSPTTPPTTPPPRVIPPHTWIFENSAFNEVIADPTAASRLANDVIYLLGGKPIAGYNIIPTANFTDETTLQNAIVNHTLASYVKAVQLDIEDWPPTPQAQYDNPYYYYALGEQYAHNAGYKFVATPGTDLTTALNPGVKGDPADVTAYLGDNLAYCIAGGNVDIGGSIGDCNSSHQTADVIDIQAQRMILEPNNLYVSFLQQAGAQAKSGNSGVTVVGGISTCAGSPNGAQLASGMIESNPYVSGWWMNIPAEGPQTPNCAADATHIGYAITAIDSLPWY